MCCSLDAHLSQKREYTAFICCIFNKNRSACPILSLFHYQIKYQILCDQDVKYVRRAYSHLETRSMCWRDPISKKRDLVIWYPDTASVGTTHWLKIVYLHNIPPVLTIQFSFQDFFSCHISCHLSHLWKHQSFHFLQSATHSWLSTPRYFF